nr:hypothetical protein [Clostridioides difficile]
MCIRDISYAKALAYTLNIPLVGVNHIEGHLSANYIEPVSYTHLTLPTICSV